MEKGREVVLSTAMRTAAGEIKSFHIYLMCVCVCAHLIKRRDRTP